MQSIFRLPWCSDQVMPKLQDTMSFDPLRASTMAEMAGLTKLKRKHATTSDAGQPRTQAPKKARLEHSWPQQIVASPKPVQLSTVPVAPAKRQAAIHVSIPPVAYTTPSVITSLPQQVIPEMSHVPTEIQHSKPAPVARAMADPSKLTQVIENEFNMQILLKHNELRLIEQELAKCQVALEQLRRCELRPYPGSDRLSLAVTDGTGPAISPQPGMTQPTHAAPFGVADGPYSRHYAQWLLHDHQFDSVPISYAPSADCGDASARSTRTGSTVRKSSSKSIALPSYRDAHASLSHAPASAPRDKSAPLVLRRSTDNQLVKLVCNTCNRGNFSSIQGFLNHCRIAHKVDYKSHDAAALDCGRELTEQEAANLPADAATTPAAKPAPAAKVVLHAAIPVKGQVHPLNATGELPALSKVKTPSSKAKAVNSKIETSHLQGNSPFRGTKLAPHLSAHFSKFKLSGDLHEAVAAARQRVDLSSAEDELSLSEVSTPVSPMDLTRPEMAGFLARPLSSKGYREPLQRTRPSPLVPVVRHASPDYLNDTPMLTPNLSPNGTDSNPGMVSDHEDDDHASGSEDEAPQTASLAHSLPVRRTCADSMDIDVIEDDDVNDHGVVIRRNSMLAYDDGPGTTNSSPSRPALVKKPSK